MIEKKDIIKSVVETISPSIRFVFEDWNGFLRDNTLISFNKLKDGTKYPMILMHSDVGTESRGQEIGIDNKFTAEFYIITNSKLEYNTEKRIDDVFKPIIYPIFDKLIFALFDSISLDWNDEPLAFETFLPCETENIYKGQITNKQTNQVAEIIDAMKVTITLKLRKYVSY
jgi:hypothetical protein